jgi:hypothetical protein
VSPWIITPTILSLSIYNMPCMKWWILIRLHFSPVVGLHMGSIVLLNPIVIALLLSHYSWCKRSYDGLWSSILRDMVWPIVLRCWGLSKVVIWWGRLLPSKFMNGICCDTLSVTVAAIVSLQYPRYVSTVICWIMNLVSFEIQIQILYLYFKASHLTHVRKLHILAYNHGQLNFGEFTRFFSTEVWTPSKCSPNSKSVCFLEF